MRLPRERSLRWARTLAIAAALGGLLLVAAQAAASLSALLSFAVGLPAPAPAAATAPAPASVPVSPRPAPPAPADPPAASAPVATPASEPVRVEPAVDPDAPCPLELRLSAVVYDEKSPARSIATLRGAAPGSSGDYTAGMRVGDHVLVEVLPGAARFRRGDTPCLMRMFGQRARDKIAVERANTKALARAQKRKGGATAKLAAYPPPRVLSAVELSRAVTAESDDSFRVDADVIRTALARWDEIEATTDASKVKRRGLKLRALRSDGLLQALGLRRGDVISRANGKRVGTTEHLQRAVQVLARGEPLTLVVRRGGKNVKLQYAPR